jgi:hypothetical protein
MINLVTVFVSWVSQSNGLEVELVIFTSWVGIALADGVAVELSVFNTGICKQIKLISISFQVTPPNIIVIPYEVQKISYKSICLITLHTVSLCWKWYTTLHQVDPVVWIRVITKLPNSEQSNKGKVKTHKYINRQNQSTTEKLWKP